MLLKALSFNLRLSLLCLPIFIYYTFLYTNNFNTVDFIAPLAHSLLSFISHFIILFIIVSSVIAIPISILTKNSLIRNSIIGITTFLFILAIAIDAHTFELYRFHINWAMIDLFLNAGGQVIEFSAATIISIVIEIIAIMIYCIFAIWISYKFKLKSIYAFASIVVIYLACNITHAIATAYSNTKFTSVADKIPLYHPLTANSFFIEIGLIDKGSAAKNKLNIHNDKGLLNYPKSPIVLTKSNGETFRNILIIMVDTLRADMVQPSVMPHTNEMAQRYINFTQHYSVSNSTRGGVFSFFYGLPPSYWKATYRGQQGALLISTLQQRNYELGIFGSAQMYKPEFDVTIFKEVPNLRISSQGDTPFERDLDAINDWKKFVLENKNKRMFSYIFLDNVHGVSLPKDAKLPFEPSLKSVNYMKLGNNADPEYVSQFFNLYKNCAYYSDLNIKAILDFLKENDLFDDSIILITADHGNEFNDNGKGFYGHNSNFTAAQLHIPLIVKWPGKTSRSINELSTSYDITATLMQDLLLVDNDIRDYSIGQNLFDLKPIPYFLAGSYNENAIVEDKRITLIDNLGRLRFFDKHYGEIYDQKRSPEMLQAVQLMSEYLAE